MPLTLASMAETAINRLRRWVVSTGKSQSELAEMLGLPQARMSKILGGMQKLSVRDAFIFEAATAAWSEGPIPMAAWVGYDRDLKRSPLPAPVRRKRASGEGARR